MAGKGNKRHIKRLASSRYMAIGRKASKYVIKPMPGRHTGKRSISLMTVLKEKIMSATSREAGFAIKSSSIKVNGKTVKEPKYAVGFGDLIEILPTNESFRIVSGKDGRFEIEKAKGKHRSNQTFKVIGKYVGKKGKIFLKLHDGSSVGSDNSAKVNDSVVLAEKKISKVIKLEKGSKCYVVTGTHASESGTIKEITKGTLQRNPSVKIEGSSGEFETLLRNIMVVGE